MKILFQLTEPQPGQFRATNQLGAYFQTPNWGQLCEWLLLQKGGHAEDTTPERVSRSFVAQLLGVSVKTIDNHFAAGRLTAIKSPTGRVSISREEIRRVFQK